MDDIIYLILLVAWIAFAFYRKSQKGKKESSPPKVPRQAKNPAPTLGDLIFGEQWRGNVEHVPDPNEEEEQALAAVRHPDSQEGVSLETIEPEYVKNRKLREKEAEKEMAEADQEEDEDKSYFSLRNAVVYDAILNRPYN